MIEQIKRHEIKALLKAGRSQQEAAQFTGVSLRSVKRIAREPDLESFDDAAERRRRGIGRPSVVEPFRGFVTDLLEKEPGIKSSKILRLARMNGYAGGKSAIYALVASIRGNGKPDSAGAARRVVVRTKLRAVVLREPDEALNDRYSRRDNPR